MVAGTMLRGMFEDRIQNVIRELKERPKPDPVRRRWRTRWSVPARAGRPVGRRQHLQVGPRAREIRMVAATTTSEYKEYIQEDERWARRFRCVAVCEPTIEETRQILYSLRPVSSGTTRCGCSTKRSKPALELSPRYMRHLHLPDKVIGWLDTAAVRAEIDRRWEVKTEDIVSVISHVAQIPEDMVFRDVSDRFRDIEARLQTRIVGPAQSDRRGRAAVSS
jgi:ATP-dependent Clp protease ATP-binding subunit ClpA